MRRLDSDWITHGGFGVLLILLGPMPIRGQGTPPPAWQARTDASDVLRITEPRLRPQTPDDLARILGALDAAGMADAADEIRRSVTTSAADYERLTRELISMGHLRAVQKVLPRWRKLQPRQPLIPLYRAVANYGAGEFELAARQLVNARGELPTDKMPLHRLLDGLVLLRLNRLEPGIEANPWRVRFVDASGKPALGNLAKAEADKLPPGVTDAMLELTSLLPLHGGLWGLLGELLNAAGQMEAAQACFKRAVDLRHTPAANREVNVREFLQKQARQAMGSGGLQKPNDKPADESKGGWRRLTSRPDVLLVVLGGAVVVLFLVVLQVREWCRRKAA